MVKTKKKINMTEGGILSKLILFLLPVLASSLLQTAYHTADMMVVILSSEPNAVGSIGVTTFFLNLIINLFIGFAVGANVIIARHIGAGAGEAVTRATHTAQSGLTD